MIIAEGKPIKEILAMIAPYDKILLVGCKGCVTVCSTGGEKEVGILASALRLARQAQGKPLEVKEITLERQCDTEYLEPMRESADRYPAILSLACGAGIQFLAEKFRKHPVLPGVDTQFIGVAEEQGVWTERCQACGNCVLDRRHLSGRPVFQESLQRPLRRIERREV
jgi:ferredoxin